MTEPNKDQQTEPTEAQKSMQKKIDFLRYAGFTPVQIEALVKTGAVKP